MQIEITMRYHRTAIILKNTGKDMGKRELLHTLGGNVNYNSEYREQCGGSSVN